MTYRFATNERKHVERLRRLPLGWVLIGEAVCSFDPIYGQAMTPAAQQAEVLGQRLDASGMIDCSFARSHFRAAARRAVRPAASGQ